MRRFIDFITLALSLLIIAASDVSSQERKSEASSSINQNSIVYLTKTVIK